MRPQLIFTIYDSKSDTYTNPTINPHREQARRGFSDAVNDGKSILSTHPEDFTLFELGTYCFETAKIVPHEAKIAVCNGVDVKLPSQNVVPYPASNANH